MKALFHPPYYPGEVPTKWGKIAYWWTWHMRVIDNGRGHVFGKVTQLIPEMGWIMAFLVYWGYAKPSPLVIVIVGLIMFGLVWFGGWWYTYLKIDIVQQLVTRDRDMVVRETHSMCKIMFKEMGFDFDKEIRGKNNGKA